MHRVEASGNLPTHHKVKLDKGRHGTTRPGWVPDQQEKHEIHPNGQSHHLRWAWTLWPQLPSFSDASPTPSPTRLFCVSTLNPHPQLGHHGLVVPHFEFQFPSQSNSNCIIQLTPSQPAITHTKIPHH